MPSHLAAARLVGDVSNRSQVPKSKNDVPVRESEKNAEDLEQQRKVFRDSQDRKIATQQQQDQKLTKVERELQLERSGVSEEQATKTKRNRVVCAQEAKLRQWKATHTANWDESQGGNVPGEARENSEYPCDPVDP